MATRSRASRYPLSDADRNHQLIPNSTGITTRVTMAASSAFIEKSITVTNSSVSSWIISETKPSWNSIWRDSTSLVMRVMTTPAASFV